MKSTVGVWIRANRLGVDSVVVVLGVAAVAVVAGVVASTSYRETSSVAPVLVVASLMGCVGAAVIAQPQPEGLQGTAARSLDRWRLFSAGWVVALVIGASVSAAAVLGDGWFAGPVLQALTVGSSITLLASVLVPSHVAVMGVVAYVMACYFGGGRETWNMVVHVQSRGWAVTWTLALVIAVGVFARRGPVARRPHDTE